jgi:ABC-type nitrate/sulfonate/bicarbonate transport system substrate-binding protein
LAARNMLKTVSLSLLVAIWLLHGSVSAQEKRLQSLRLAYGALSSSRIPYWIAKDAKLDEKYGLDLNLIFINGAPVALNALIAGDVHMAATSGIAPISLAAQGGPIAIIANVGSTPYKLVAHPSIKTIQGLRGKRIGSDRIGGATDFALQELLPQLGLLPGKDVQLIATGLTSSAERVLLIHRGKIDATLAVLDNVLKMELQGYAVNILADLLEHGIYSMRRRSNGFAPVSQAKQRDGQSFSQGALRGDLVGAPRQGAGAARVPQVSQDH